MIQRNKNEMSSLRDLYGDLHRLGGDLRENALRFQSLVRSGGFAEHGTRFSYDGGDPRDSLNRSIDITRRFEFLVAVTGAFSSGKSTLLNLLLDTPDLLPSSVIPLTAVCTAIRYGPTSDLKVRYVTREEGFVRVPDTIGTPFKKPFDGPDHIEEALAAPKNYVDGERAQESLRRFATYLRDFDQLTARPPTFDERAPFIAGGGLVRDDSMPSGYRHYVPTPGQEREYEQHGGDPRQWVTREWLALIRDVQIWVPSPVLENDIVFLDLPGLNCKEDYHRRAIQEYCNLADSVLVVAFQPGNQADEEVLATFKKMSANYRDKIFFALNKVDQFGAEPRELVRAVEYLERDTVGVDFPEERFFLTSGQLSRAARSGDKDLPTDLQRLSTSLDTVKDSSPALDRWINRLVSRDDPGGVAHLREQLYVYLLNDAYQSKILEVLTSYGSVVRGLRDAASPTYEEALRLNPADTLRNALVDYLQFIERSTRNSLYKFRYEYLRGEPREGGPITLRTDSKKILDRTHREIHRAIAAHFDRPLLSAPLREDPVEPFDLLRIADDASLTLRDELQNLIITNLRERVQEVTQLYMGDCDLQVHIQNLLRGAPEWQRRFDEVIERFEFSVSHSLKCLVRNAFFFMPRGREMKRLQKPVRLVELKDVLVRVFSDFYPAWIFENLYSELLDKLWLFLFLDSEDLERELGEFFHSAQTIVTGSHVADKVEIPDELFDGSRDRYRTVQLCQRISSLSEAVGELEARAKGLVTA